MACEKNPRTPDFLQQGVNDVIEECDQSQRNNTRDHILESTRSRPYLVDADFKC